MISPFAALFSLQAPPSTLAGVVAAMREIDARLEVSDGVKWFNLLYLRVTEAVERALLERTNVWNDPEWVSKLDVRFAQFYFDALAKGESELSAAPSAWKPLLERRYRQDLMPIQFALAGMNAHINRDLPFAVESVCREMDRLVELDSPLHRDFLAVNGILERVEEEVKVEFVQGLVGIADEALGRLDDVVAMWSVSRARDAAWTHAQVLSKLSRFPSLQTEFGRSLDRLTGFAGRGLLRPILVG